MAEPIVGTINVKLDTPPKNLFQAFARAQGKFRTPNLNRTARVEKEGRLLYESHYADIQEIIDCIRVPLMENGLSFFQLAELQDKSWYLVLELAHESGEVKRSSLPLNVNQTNQQLGGTLTYLKRYQLSAFFGLAADFDDDGNATEGNQVSFSDGPKKNQSQPRTPVVQKLSEAQLKRLYAIGSDNSWPSEAIRILCVAKTDLTPSKISKDQYDQLCMHLEMNPFDEQAASDIDFITSKLTEKQKSQLEKTNAPTAAQKTAKQILIDEIVSLAKAHSIPDKEVQDVIRISVGHLKKTGDMTEDELLKVLNFMKLKIK